MRSSERELAYKRAWWAAHREELLIKRKAYYVAHREEILAHNKIYRDTHKEESRTRYRAWREKNLERARAWERTYNQDHREQRNAYAKSYQASHRQQVKEQKAEWNRKNKEKVRNNRLKKLYGLTQTEFDTLFKSQDGRCAICRTDKFNSRGPMVDHDHITGQVRGILCHTCNLGIGYFKECADLFYRALDYLEKYSAGWSDEMPDGLRKICEEQAAIDKTTRGEITTCVQ